MVPASRPAGRIGAEAQVQPQDSGLLKKEDTQGLGREGLLRKVTLKHFPGTVTAAPVRAWQG